MKVLEKPLVINLFAGPGTGKSTAAAQIFANLKWNNINCELVNEFAKEKVWDESYKILDDQIYIFAKQLHKMRRLVGKVDVIITDSPLLFSLIYDKSKNENLKNLILDVNKEFRNFNFFLTRKKEYVRSGRMQNENEAKKLDKEILKTLKQLNINTPYGKYMTFNAKKEDIDKLSNIVIFLTNQEKLSTL